MWSVCEKSVESTFSEARGRLGSAETLLVTTHSRPDGDGLGAMAALCRSGRAAGKTVHMLLLDEIPRRYEFLFAEGTPAGVSRFETLSHAADAIVILDTCVISQLDGIGDKLPGVSKKVIVVDHHATVDRIGAVQWVDTSAAATGVMVGELLEALGWPVDVRSAEALIAAAASDTGWFQFANTDGRCMRLVAKWLDKGVRPDKLYRRLYQNARVNRLKLLSHILADMELHCDGRLAVMTVRREDFAATGASADETENLVNASLEIGTVETAIMLVENAENIRVSLRSRDVVDVATIAEMFGGGGHKRAAGMRIIDSIDVVKDKLINICAKALDEGR